MFIALEDALVADALLGIVLQTKPSALFESRFWCRQWDTLPAQFVTDQYIVRRNPELLEVATDVL